jgi:hypothetical protein
MDAESPDVFLRAEIVPIEIRAGRDTAIFFELMNKNNYDLKNDRLIELEGIQSKVKIKIENGYVFVYDSGCPEKLCINKSSSVV